MGRLRAKIVAHMCVTRFSLCSKIRDLAGNEGVARVPYRTLMSVTRVRFPLGPPLSSKDSRSPPQRLRTLAYVFLEDGTFLNAEIIKQGYGHAYTRFPFKYLGEFIRYEREAREQKKGLWGEST